MRRIVLLWLVGATACTSTRQLADPLEPRLRSPGNTSGFAVRTTDRWRGRIDPQAELRFRDARGRWTQTVDANDLRVDQDGAWIEQDGTILEAADEIEIANLPADLARSLAETQPAIGAQLRGDRGGWHLTGESLHAWIDTFFVRAGDAPLGEWRFHVAAGWVGPVDGDTLTAMLQQRSMPVRTGWRWSDMRAVEVTNVSGAKTLAALPLLFGVQALELTGGSPYVTSGGGDGQSAPAAWPATLARDGADPRPLFSTGARARGWVLPMLVLDGGIAGDANDAGALVRLRLGGMYDVGGGARRIDFSDQRATLAVAQLGMHLAIDADERVAVPVGVELGAGGDVREVAIEAGVRVRWGRWFGTVLPLVPRRLSRDGAAHWDASVRAEVGATL
ncbi:MAG TPA: hypothetical protein VGF94_18845 [Kofleriaceae bacterium]